MSIPSSSVIWVWIPRTAGTSIHCRLTCAGERRLFGEQATLYLRNPPVLCFGHMPPQLAIDRNLITRDAWSKHDSFIVIRNPWDRAVSLWRYWQGRKKKENRVSFTEFLREVKKSPCFATGIHGLSGVAHAFPQSKWLWFDDGMPTTNHIIRFESIVSDLNALSNEIQISLEDVGHANASNRPKDYHEAYTPAAKELVARIYTEDIERLGYTYD